MAGKCPYCGKYIKSLRIDGLKASAPLSMTWKAITYNCPLCNMILGCQIDPIAIKTDIINELEKRLSD
jgi:hypothetical protein